MPLIDTPFKRVADDIVGPIGLTPPSEAGHRIILTLVDYATRYPEAVPLKKITTEAVAETLFDIFEYIFERFFEHICKYIRVQVLQVNHKNN